MGNKILVVLVFIRWSLKGTYVRRFFPHLHRRRRLWNDKHNPAWMSWVSTWLFASSLPLFGAAVPGLSPEAPSKWKRTGKERKQRWTLTTRCSQHTGRRDAR